MASSTMLRIPLRRLFTIRRYCTTVASPGTSSGVSENPAETQNEKLGGFAKAFERYTKESPGEDSEADSAPKAFVSLLRNCKLMQVCSVVCMNCEILSEYAKYLRITDHNDLGISGFHWPFSTHICWNYAIEYLQTPT